MATATRAREGRPLVRDRLIHHSDAGSQYTSIRLTEHLLTEGILPSIGTVGDAYDNALAETNMGLYKSECIETDVFHDGPYRSLADVEHATAAWSPGTTMSASTALSVWFHPSSTKPLTTPPTRPPRRARNPP